MQRDVAGLTGVDTQRAALIVMVKEPVPGRVKTRLAHALGAAAAAAFYGELMRATIERLSGTSEWQTILAVTPDAAADRAIWPCGVHRFGQGGGDLGQRMARQFARFDAPAVLIGSDIPDIGQGDIRTALRLLDDHDSVFGPAPDGGYWLVGFARGAMAAKAFDNVRFSSAFALADTLSNLSQRRVAMVDEKRDIDTIDDYRAWQAAQRT